MKRVAFHLAFAACLVVSSGARAQSPDRAAAAALYDRAEDQMELGDYAKACRLLEEVTRLAPDALGAKLELGRCYEGEGRLASAWVQYTEVEDLASRSGQPDPVREVKARAAASAIRDKLAYLVVEVPEAWRRLEGLTVTRDGVEIGAAQLGTPVPVDKGRHVIEVTAPGYEAWRSEVVVKTGGASVVVTAEAPIKSTKKSPAPVQPVRPKVTPVFITPRLVEVRPWQKPAGVVLASAGALSIGIGALLGGLAIAQYRASNEENHCDVRGVCDATGFSLRRDALNLGNGSTVLYGLGGVAVVGGVVMLATVPAPVFDYEGASGSLGLRITPGGAWISGRF